MMALIIHSLVAEVATRRGATGALGRGVAMAVPAGCPVDPGAFWDAARARVLFWDIEALFLAHQPSHQSFFQAWSPTPNPLAQRRKAAVVAPSTASP